MRTLNQVVPGSVRWERNLELITLMTGRAWMMVSYFVIYNYCYNRLFNNKNR